MLLHVQDDVIKEPYFKQTKMLSLQVYATRFDFYIKKYGL